MEKTVCELFAGVGGFRCGLNHINTLEDIENPEAWETVWFSQWEPAEKKTQYAHDCYVHQFGTCLDLDGNDTTNMNIEDVDKEKLPDFNLLVGGFPCQDYSVASTLSSSRGIEGKKGVLWWSVRETIEKKNPPFVLLENVDRLLKSPASQRGRDFAIILACLRDEGYSVEWRVINAAEYGYQQRRRRTFIFAYKQTTNFSTTQVDEETIMLRDGFFATTFPVDTAKGAKVKTIELPTTVGEVSKSFSFDFENAGFMKDGHIWTIDTVPVFDGVQITLGDIMDDGDIDEKYFVPEDRLYYTDPDVTHSNELEEVLPASAHHTWQYLKGAKKYYRESKTGFKYVYSEGSMPMIDEYDKPARTMLTTEGGFNRMSHIVKDKKTGKIRLLTANEAERIQGFPTDHTKFCLVNGAEVEMPLTKRRFMMGNALVVNLIKDMEVTLSRIFENE